MNNDIITGVAFLTGDGRMVALPKPHRHHHLFAVAALLGIDPGEAKQGFTTREGAFASRTAAFKMVVQHGQHNRRSGNPGSRELFSEDVW